MIYLALSVWYILIFGNAYADGSRPNLGPFNGNGKTILFGYHLAAWIIRYMIGFLIILYIWYQSDVPYHRETAGVFLLFGSTAWILFDHVYNYFAEMPYDYVGRSSWLDSFFHNFENPFKVQMIIKLFLFIDGLALYFI
jgi:hypothetical protein